MARINLLPWREDQRQQRQQQVKTIVVATLIFVGLVLYSMIFFINSLIDKQNDRNIFLQGEIAALDEINKEVKALQQEKQHILAKMQVIQDLQESRPKVVRLLDSLARVAPAKIYLEQITRQGELLTLSGVAEGGQPYELVSNFMTKLNADVEFNEPNLQKIEQAKAGDNTYQKFVLNVTESKPKTDAQPGEI